MDMNEIKNLYPNCPNCGRHCPIDAVSCPRGQAFVEKLLSGELEAGEAVEQGHGHGAYSKGHEHLDHGEGREHGGEHKRRSEHGFHRGQDGEEHARHEHGERGEGHGHSCCRHITPDDGSLASLLHQCMHSIRHGVPQNMGQGRILRILSETEELGQRELQERLGIQPGSLSEILNKLENKGYIQRSRDEQDKRKASLHITEEGRKALTTLRPEPDQRDPFAVLSEEEQETLRSLLTKILNENR